MHLYLLLFLTSLHSSVYAGSSGEKCCPRKKVGEKQYTFSHQSEAAEKEYGCSNDCVYTEDGNGDETCFRPGSLEAECLGPKCKTFQGPPKTYCQPGQTCWPTPQNIEEFKDQLWNITKHIGGANISCLGLPIFVSKHNANDHKIKNGSQNECLQYNGLLNNINHNHNYTVGGDLRPCQSKKLLESNYLEPNPNCDSNPYITKAYYKRPNHPNQTDQIACMSPYQYLTNRNYKEEWMPAFIVTASTPEEVSAAIKFANKFNLGVAVMSTGHDLQDRNAGPGPNSLLIRTTCFREFKNFTNENITGYNDTVWTEGYAIVGAGLTFGKNYWYNVTNAEGLYPLTYAVGREIVGGSCHSVGIIGWTLGAGKGLTTPMYGYGVDQLLNVDLVLADGTITNANYTHNTDLFKALRGGGPGFGVITSIKIKLHKPICGTMENCYQFWSSSWVGNWTGKPEQIDEIKTVLNAAFEWKAAYPKYWTSYMDLKYDNKTNNFTITLKGNHFGTKAMNETDYNSFASALKHLKIQNTRHLFNSNNQSDPIKAEPIITDKYYCELFPNPDNTSECGFLPWTVQRWSQYIRFLVNSTTTVKKTDNKNGKETNEFLDALIETWQPLCDNQSFSACTSGFQLHYFFTNGDTATNTGGSISPGFRNALVEVYNNGVHNNNVSMTFEQKESWMHYTLAPAMYKFSNASYMSEAEYTLNPGQWEERFWGEEIYEELLETKKKYDPDFRLNCRHCVGSQIV